MAPLQGRPVAPSPLNGTEDDIEMEDDAERGQGEIPRGDTISDHAGREGSKVLEPPQPKKSAKPPEAWGTPEPSKVRESLSFPVLARYTYDGYRAKYPQYHGTYAEFMLEMFQVACRRIGMWPSMIWTEPEAAPPPTAVQPVFAGQDIDLVFEEPASAT